MEYSRINDTISILTRSILFVQGAVWVIKLRCRKQGSLPKRCLLSLLLLIGLGSAGVANASEGFLYGGPTGSDAMDAAYLPPPGLYGFLVLGTAHSTSLYGNNAREITGLNFGVHGYAPTFGLTYVYPFTLAGGSLASSILDNYQSIHLTINNVPSHATGFGDLYVNFLSWSKHLGGADDGSKASAALPYGLTVKLAFSMQFPIGEYNASAPVSVGYNTKFFSPNAAVSYLTGPSLLGDGTEFSLAIWYDIASENRVHAYKTGDVVDFDWAVSEHLGLWQIGLHGNYASQVRDDVVAGVSIGNRLGASGIGPVVSYVIPAWKAVVRLNATAPLWTRNTNHLSSVYLVFVKKFE